MPEDAPHSGNATVREVYSLVNEVRDDLGGRIDDLRETVSDLVTSHEHRLTVVEQSSATHAEQLVALTERVDKHGLDIADAQGKLRTAEANSTRRVSNRQWAIGLVVLVIASGLGALIGALVN